MFNRISPKFLTVTALISVTGYLLYRYRMYVVTGLIYFIITIMRIGSPPPVPTDRLMIEHFIKNEQTFDRLLRLSSLSVLDWDNNNSDDLSFRSFLENNPLYYYNLLPVQEEKKDIRTLSIVDREKERKHLMKKLKINSCSGINPNKVNSIEFIYFYNSDILMGYEFVFDRTKENPNRVFIKEEEDLYDVCRKRHKTDGAYFKRINNNWNLYIVRLY